MSRSYRDSIVSRLIKVAVNPDKLRDLLELLSIRNPNLLRDLDEALHATARGL